MRKEQQRAVLLGAINKYLAWRKNKNLPDGRGYPLGAFTKLRHLTPFGKTRANNLRNALLSDLRQDPIRLLQGHFRNKSSIKNHSLDTYLLESIVENKYLFLITSEYERLRTKISRKAARDVIINQDEIMDREYHYKIGKLYEDDAKAEDHLQKACAYYSIAVQENHEPSCSAIEKLATAGNSEAQYILGFEYYHKKNRLNESIKWCMCAAEKHYPKATTYLSETKFSAEHYVMIAKKYDEGIDVARNRASATAFYEKAFALNNKYAAFRLGQLCQLPQDSSERISIRLESKEPHETQKNERKAFNYYLVAAKQKDAAALKVMEVIAEKLDDDKLRFNLGQVYLDNFLDYILALTCFKKLADKNIAEAKRQIDTLASSSPEYAFVVAKLYEDDAKAEDHLQKACIYYAIAAQKKHEPSRSALEKLATAGNSEAQYILGAEYYHKNNRLNEAIKWCMCAAEKHHPKATTYLSETKFSAEHYVMIAKKYDEADGVKRNLISAKLFYEKAFALNDKYAAFRLGQLCQLPQDLSVHTSTQLESKEPHGQQINERKAFDYYLVAAKQKDAAALKAMEVIAEKLNDDKLRFILGQIYFDVLSCHALALTCFKKLADKDIAEAKHQISTLTSREPEYAYIVGKLYEDDDKAKDYLQKACMYYKIGLQKDHWASRSALEKLATAGNSEAQYILGVEYHHKNNRINEAIKWCMCAAEKHHPKATTYLSETKFSAEHYVMIAKKYDEADGVKRNLISAKLFYEKAFALNNKYAARRLGQLYQPQIEDSKTILSKTETRKDAEKSFDYYSVAAKQGDEDSLKAMELIAEQVDDDKLRFKVGQTYQDSFANPVVALKCFKRLADRNFKEAATLIDALAQKNPEHAFLVGKLHEEDEKTEVHLLKSCTYYIIAIQNEHKGLHSNLAQIQLDKLFNSDELTPQELTNIGKKYCDGTDRVKKDYARAKQWFEKACEKGCEIAHYELGIFYQSALGVRRDLVKAARYFQLAHQKGHRFAKDKLEILLNSKEITRTELMTIASMYQNGSDGIDIDWPRTAMLYHRAAELGDASAALYLGHFYQVNHTGVKKDIKLSFQAYLQAAKLGSCDALSPLERLGEEASKEGQLALSKLYGSFFHNQKKSAYWQSKASEVEEFKLSM